MIGQERGQLIVDAFTALFLIGVVGIALIWVVGFIGFVLEPFWLLAKDMIAEHRRRRNVLTLMGEHTYADTLRNIERMEKEMGMTDDK